MSEKRFRQFGLWVADDEQDKYFSVEQVVSVLNEQQSTISQLQKKVSEYELLYQSCSMERDEFFRGATENAKLVGEQQATINKLRKILAEAEDTIELRCAEHYVKEYENIKHHIIGDNDE